MSRAADQIRQLAFRIRILLLAALLTGIVISPVLLLAQDDAEAPRLLKADSQAPYLHRLTLYDQSGKAIDPSDSDAPPYSPKMTCGKCHAYGEIACGWHFNAGTGAVPAGRPGEPWILADARLGVQIPISARGWRGTFLPARAGLTAWRFTLLFGRQLPGGGLSEPDLAAERPASAPAQGEVVLPPTETEKKRWAISGPLEIDCMVCHAGTGSGYDAGEIERQVEKQNFRWVPTAALGLGVIRGEARTVASDYEPDLPPPPDRTDLTLPKVVYEQSRFDADKRVLFDIVREPANERCLYCHSTRFVGAEAAPAWRRSPDVHMAAGMRCSACHAHGIDHAMNRGADDAAQPRSAAPLDNAIRPAQAELTCRGCHTGGERSLGGRGGAPHPAHAGIPPLHFDKLACTACHSGLWPESTLASVQTSFSHALGVGSKERREDSLPHIVEPVFASSAGPRSPADSAFRITPGRLLWPAYWAKRNGATLEMLDNEFVTKNAARTLPKRKGHSYEQAPDALSDEQITATLAALSPKLKDGGAPVYVRGGALYSLTAEGALTHAADPAAAAYVWPVAHNVRPAQQSLGVRGCTDCHAEDAPIFFGTTAARSGFAASQPAVPMHEFSGYDALLADGWVALFRMREPGKWALALVCVVLGFALLRWAGISLAPRTSQAGANLIDGHCGGLCEEHGRRHSGGPVADRSSTEGGQAQGKDRSETGPSSATRSAQPGARPGGLSRISRLRCGIAIVAGLAAAFQGATSLLPAKFEGWMSLAHTAAIPVFLVAVAAWGLLWTRSAARRGVREWLTWCTLGAALGLMTVMLLAMLPLFDTDVMRELLEWHERFGIAMLVGLALVAVWSVAGGRAPARKG